jgi:hypothetical protein
MWSAGPGDDQARFLADLRSLRDVAAIGYDELAARAHYPSDILKEAENGPVLPGLPVLTAYVRACDGDVLDWEERWRRLASEVPEDPGLPIRPPGASPAAVAGARAGVGVTPPDVYDPERIRAALRGGQGRSDQGRGSGFPARGSEFSDLKLSSAGWGTDTDQETGARRDADASLEVGTDLEAGAGWNAHPSWDAPADQTIAMTNGNHSARNGSRGPFDAAVVEMPDPAERTDHTDQFRWLPDTSATPGPIDTWTDAANAGFGADAGFGTTDTGLGATDTGFGTTDTGFGATDTGLGAPLADDDVTPIESAVGEWAPWHQDSAPDPSERSDFWTTPGRAGPADLHLPAAPPHRAEERPFTRASWSASTETAASPETTGTSAASAVSDPFKPSAIDTAPSAQAAQPRTSAERAGSASTAQTLATEPADQQKDRFFPVRLLVMIVIAALIGSALVLLLR